MDDIEEVIYSQGEPYPDELHENKSWDSDDNSTSDKTTRLWSSKSAVFTSIGGNSF